MVRDQVVSIVDAAAASAASTERDALARRDAMLAEAREATALLCESIATMADQLDDLRSAATREADTLRSLLARGGPGALGAGAGTVHRLDAAPVESEATSYLDESAAGDPRPPVPHAAEPVDADWRATAAAEGAADELVGDAEVVEPAIEAGEGGLTTEAQAEQAGLTTETEAERPPVWGEVEVEQPPVWGEVEVEQPPVWGEVEVELEGKAAPERPPVGGEAEVELEEAEPEQPPVGGEGEAEEPPVWVGVEEAEPEQPSVWGEAEAELEEAEPEQPPVWGEAAEAEDEQPVAAEAEDEEPPVWVGVEEAEPEQPSVWGEVEEAEPEQPSVWGEDGQAQPERPEAAEEDPADRDESELVAPKPEAGAEPSLDEHGRGRVAGSSDDGLAETYVLAVESYALAVDRGDVEDAKLWEAIRRAAIEEAHARPELGRTERDPSVSRRERRQLNKRLRALIKARGETAAAPPDA